MKLAFEFTILCAARTSETLHATWDEVDLLAKTWTIPGVRMKSGIEHRVPLSKRSVEILRQAKLLSGGGPIVFPGRSERKPLSNMVFLMALRRMKQDDLTAAQRAGGGTAMSTRRVTMCAHHIIDALVTALLGRVGLFGALRRGLAYLLGNARRAHVDRDRRTGRLRAGLGLVEVA